MFVVEFVRQFDKNVEQVYIIIIIMIFVQFICVFCQFRDIVFYILICIFDKICMDNFVFKIGFIVQEIMNIEWECINFWVNLI